VLRRSDREPEWYVPVSTVARVRVRLWVRLSRSSTREFLVQAGAQRPRAQLPGGSGDAFPTLRQLGGQHKLQLSARQPGQLQRVVRRTARMLEVFRDQFAEAGYLFADILDIEFLPLGMERVVAHSSVCPDPLRLCVCDH